MFAKDAAVTAAMNFWWRFSRGMTLGVRGVATDEAGRVMLVRHGYVPGWHLPGGGVERGQTAEQAMADEFRQEAGIELTEQPTLLSAHWHAPKFPLDHILLYRARGWRPCPPQSSVREIAERGFFPLNALPEATTRATRRRLAETFEGVAANGHW